MQSTFNIELFTHILKFDELIRDFSEKHLEEFRVYLEFPAVARQREQNETLIGYKDEALFYTAQTLSFIENSKEIPVEIVTRLIGYINDFLDLEAKAGKVLLNTEERKICLDLLAELAAL